MMRVMQTTTVSKGLVLVAVPVSAKVKAVPTEAPPTSHVFIVDCSGSMSGVLPDMRAQIKSKIPALVGEKDTVSLIWFSGRGEYGVIFEDEPLGKLSDLAKVNAMVDRWLRPTGLTGFKEPLEEAGKLIDRLEKKAPGRAVSLMFLSDGYDNTWSKKDIFAALGKLKPHAAVVVEYGYYADRTLLGEMAAKLGGASIFVEDFDSYEPQMGKILGKKVVTTPKKEVVITGDVVGNVAFTLTGGEVITYEVEGGKCYVPADTTEVYALVAQKSGTYKTASVAPKDTAPLYGAMSLMANRGMGDVVLDLLKHTGDVALIQRFSGCFGKQRYSDFMAAAKAAAFEPSARLAKGYDPSKVPDDNATTVLDVLALLSDDGSNRVLVYHPDFKYNRVSRAREDASTRFTEEESQKIAALNGELTKKPTVKRAKEIQSELAAILASKPEPLKFTPSEEEKVNGASIAHLTYNEDRPNVSILVQTWGTVDLSGRIPDSLKGKVPETFGTFIHRNYTIIRDGLVNVKSLPVKVTEATLAKLKSMGVGILSEVPGDSEVTAVLDLSTLPTINRSMIKKLSAKEMASKVYRLTEARARQKVFQAYLKDHTGGKASEGFKALYGDEASTWLKDQGITDYGGFSPKQVTAESTDFYMGKEMSVALKGLSTLPSLKEVAEKIAKGGKLTLSASLMASAISEYQSNYPVEGLTWLRGKAEEATRECRTLLREIAMDKFALVLGQTWFPEFKSLDDNVLTIKTASGDIQATFKMEEVKIKL